jgi:hypothetical protein
LTPAAGFTEAGFNRRPCQKKEEPRTAVRGSNGGKVYLPFLLS